MDLANAKLRGASLRRALVRSSDMESADLSGGDFSDADLEGNDLESANLQRSILNGARLRGNDLESADLMASQAIGADFSGANLGRARLTWGRFDRARMEAVNLSSARLDHTSLQDADLTRARLGQWLVVEPDAVIPSDFGACSPLPSCATSQLEQVSDDTGVGALLQDTRLDGANLSFADLKGIVMLRGSLRRARLNQAHVHGARWLSVSFDHTLCPNGQRSSKPCTGFDVPTTGPAEQQAMQRFHWLQALPWPRD